MSEAKVSTMELPVRVLIDEAGLGRLIDVLNADRYQHRRRTLTRRRRSGTRRDAHGLTPILARHLT